MGPRPRLPGAEADPVEKPVGQRLLAAVQPQSREQTLPGGEPGIEETYGSWKTIWMSRALRSRAALPRGTRPERVRPATETVPASGRTSPTSIRATVVLPEPDSPTMPSEPPGWTVKEMPSAAVSLPPPGSG